MRKTIFNEEFRVNVTHQVALSTSLSFLHTARRTNRLNGTVKLSDRGQCVRLAYRDEAYPLNCAVLF